MAAWLAACMWACLRGCLRGCVRGCVGGCVGGCVAMWLRGWAAASVALDVNNMKVELTVFYLVPQKFAFWGPPQVIRDGS